MAVLLDRNDYRQRRSRRGAASQGQLDGLIERLAISSDADLGKLDRLLAYQDRIHRDQARVAFDVAFSRLQLALPTLAENGEIRDRNGKLEHTYALWEDINEIIKPILAEHGFALWFRTKVDGNRIAVAAVLSHIGGHAEETTLHFPADLTGGKNAVQAIGSSTSYGKRYTAAALLNLTSRGEDDDGSAARSEPTISAEQSSALLLLMANTDADEAKLLAYLKIRTLEDLPASRFDRAVDAIRLRGARS